MARLCAALAVLLGAPASAQLSLANSPVSVTSAAGVGPVRWPDVAYDPVNGVYLAVSGAGNIQAQFIAADGTTLGAAQQVNDDTMYAQAPRVAFSANAGAWLVAWHSSLAVGGTQVTGRRPSSRT